MRVTRLFQSPFGMSNTLLRDPERFGRCSRATDGFGAKVTKSSQSFRRCAIAVGGVGSALQFILEFGGRVQEPKNVCLADKGGHDERAPVESEPLSAVGSAVEHDLV